MLHVSIITKSKNRHWDIFLLTIFIEKFVQYGKKKKKLLFDIEAHRSKESPTPNFLVLKCVNNTYSFCSS